MSVAKVMWQPYVVLLWALPASVVIAGLVTVYIAFHFADSEVDGNYYREGLAINEEKQATQHAADLNLQAHFERSGNWLTITMHGQAITDKTLLLKFSHPTLGDRDHTVTLERSGDGSYRGYDAALGEQSWYIRLTPADGQWRLQTRASFLTAFNVDAQSDNAAMAISKP